MVNLRLPEGVMPGSVATSRKEAFATGKTLYYGMPCRTHTDYAVRWRADARCVLCNRERMRKRYAANVEAARERNRKWRKANPEYHRERCRQWYWENREYRSEYKRRHRKENREAIRAYERRHARTTARRADRAFRGGERRALVPTPKGVTCDDFIPFAEARAILEESTGEKWHIDHVVPLALAGLNAPSNLMLYREGDHRVKSSIETTIRKAIETDDPLRRLEDTFASHLVTLTYLTNEAIAQDIRAAAHTVAYAKLAGVELHEMQRRIEMLKARQGAARSEATGHH